MLDFLMLRPEDGKLWKDTGPDSVRYIVLDELHTYDGAQGSDVACLLRRLRAKLNLKPGSYCCVGTSATLAGDEATATGDLIDFASKLFGVRFPRDSVITEDRLDMGEYLTDDEEYPDLPTPTPDMVPTAGDAIEGYVERQCKLWFGKSGLDPLGVGRELRKHGFLRTILLNLEGKITDWATLTDRIARWDTQFEGFSRRGPPPHVAVVPGPGQSRQTASGRQGRAVPGLPGATVDSGDEPAGAGRGGAAGLLLAGRDAAGQPAQGAAGRLLPGVRAHRLARLHAAAGPRRHRQLAGDLPRVFRPGPQRPLLLPGSRAGFAAAAISRPRDARPGHRQAAPRQPVRGRAGASLEPLHRRRRRARTRSAARPARRTSP